MDQSATSDHRLDIGALVEGPAQLGEGPPQPGLHSVEGHPGPPGDLARRQVVEVAKQEGGAAGFRQRRDTISELTKQFRPGCLFGRGWDSFGLRGSELPDPATGAGAGLHPRQIAHRARKPGTDRSSRLGQFASD